MVVEGLGRKEGGEAVVEMQKNHNTNKTLKKKLKLILIWKRGLVDVIWLKLVAKLY